MLRWKDGFVDITRITTTAHYTRTKFKLVLRLIIGIYALRNKFSTGSLSILRVVLALSI